MTNANCKGKKPVNRLQKERFKANIVSLDRTLNSTSERSVLTQFKQWPSCRSVIQLTLIKQFVCWGTLMNDNRLLQGKKQKSIECRTTRFKHCFAGIFTARSSKFNKRSFNSNNYRTVNSPWSLKDEERFDNNRSLQGKKQNQSDEGIKVQPWFTGIFSVRSNECVTQRASAQTQINYHEY